MTAPNPFIPKYPNRMVLLSIGNQLCFLLFVFVYYLIFTKYFISGILINLGLAVGHWFIKFGNFGNYLLTLFMVNLVLYLSFYIVMKLISKEKLLFWPLLYILLAVIFWSTSMYFYVHKSSSWTVSIFTFLNKMYYFIFL